MKFSRALAIIFWNKCELGQAAFLFGESNSPKPKSEFLCNGTLIREEIELASLAASFSTSDCACTIVGHNAATMKKRIVFRGRLM